MLKHVQHARRRSNVNNTCSIILMIFINEADVPKKPGATSLEVIVEIKEARQKRNCIWHATFFERAVNVRRKAACLSFISHQPQHRVWPNQFASLKFMWDIRRCPFPKQVHNVL